MIKIDDFDDLNNQINNSSAVLVYFSGENCSVCKVLKPKIQKEVEKEFPKMKQFEVQTDLYKDITAHFMIFSIPTTLVFFNSKEFKRYGRNMSVPLFVEELKRPYYLISE